MTTVRELADKLGVSRQAVLNYAKTELGVKPQPRKACQLTDKQCAAVASHFADSVSAADQQLHNKTDKQTDKQTDKLVSSLQIEVARLQAVVNGLERENALLKDRLEVADAALEREQQRAMGFWSRLGQKLLGSGKPADGNVK